MRLMTLALASFLGACLVSSTASAAELPGPPAAPTVRPGGPRVVIQWAAVPQAFAYRLYRQVGEGPWHRLTNPHLEATLYFDSDLAPGERHRYCVTALEAGGLESAPSAEVAVHVPARAATERPGY